MLLVPPLAFWRGAQTRRVSNVPTDLPTPPDADAASQMRVDTKVDFIGPALESANSTRDQMWKLVRPTPHEAHARPSTTHTHDGHVCLYSPPLPAPRGVSLHITPHPHCARKRRLGFRRPAAYGS